MQAQIHVQSEPQVIEVRVDETTRELPLVVYRFAPDAGRAMGQLTAQRRHPNLVADLLHDAQLALLAVVAIDNITVAPTDLGRSEEGVRKTEALLTQTLIEALQLRPN